LSEKYTEQDLRNFNHEVMKFLHTIADSDFMLTQKMQKISEKISSYLIYGSLSWARENPTPLTDDDFDLLIWCLREGSFDWDAYDQLRYIHDSLGSHYECKSVFFLSGKDKLLLNRVVSHIKHFIDCTPTYIDKMRQQMNEISQKISDSLIGRSRDNKSTLMKIMRKIKNYNYIETIVRVLAFIDITNC